MRNSIRFTCAISLLLSLSGITHANDSGAPDVAVQSLQTIEQAVHDFVLSRQETSGEVDVTVKPVDTRLRLAACDEPLGTAWSPGSRSFGRVTVQVSCTGPKPWRIHVQSTVTLEGMVWVLARGVQRGDVLSTDTVMQKSVKVGGSGGVVSSMGNPITDIDPWLGYAFSQRVGAGKVLDERMLKPAMMVKKGEMVLIVHESAGLALQTRGVAMSSAAKGHRVQIRNKSSGKVLEATVLGRGLVQVL